jgi:glycosyltransferase involved in cell wall biosynthesis
VRSLLRFSWHALRAGADVVYVENFGYAGLGAAWLAKIFRGSRIVMSTGDDVSAFAYSHFGLPKALVMSALEKIAHTTADRLITCGPYHRDLLEQQGYERVEWIPGGVDTSRFRPFDATTLRRRLGVDGRLTIGVVGSLNWNHKTGFCYGRDVLEVIRCLGDCPVTGLVVGSGDGLPRLQALAREWGIADRVVMTGRIAHDDVPEYINAIDVCLSTQSNDAVGAARLTAKVPEYLACGRYIIASDVGGARDFVRDSGKLIPIEGRFDEEYAQRVADHVREILQRPELLERGLNGVAVARRHFDYSLSRPRLSAVLASVSPVQ